MKKDRNFDSQDNFFEDDSVINSFSGDEPVKDADFSYKKRERLFKERVKDEKRRVKKISRKNRMFFNVMWISMVAVIGFMLSQLFMSGVRDMLAMNRTTENVVAISIPSNSSHSDVAKILGNNGVISSPDWFSTYLDTFKHSTKFSKGDYEIKTNLEYEEIISHLNTKSNRKDTVDVTFTEGLSVLEYAELLEENNICKKDAFLQKCNTTDFDESFEFLKNIPQSDKYYYRLEGYLYPDTYKFYQDDDVNLIIEKMLLNFENKMINPVTVDGYAEKVSMEQVASDKGFTLHELLTLASIVQAEAADTEDMKGVASVLLNRLNADVNAGFMYLSLDSTLYYPYKTKEEAPTGFVSRYDTYTSQGLPPGPIRNPGMDSINGVLNHLDTNYMYFCHDKDGNAYYATTAQQHKNNMVKAGINVEN